MSNPHVVSSHYNVSNTVVDFTCKSTRGRTRDFIIVFFVLLLSCILLNLPSWSTSIICVAYIILILIVQRNEVIEESVLVIKDFGVQLRVKYALGFEEIKFLERAKIEDVVIHEFIQGMQLLKILVFFIPASITFYNYPRSVCLLCSCFSGVRK